MLTKLQERIWNVLINLDGEQVAQILTDIHGTQILDEAVLKELEDQGWLDEENDPEEDIGSY